MNSEILQKLEEWRREQARKEGVEVFRVLSNAALFELAMNAPSNRDEMMQIKGIKEKKFEKYGKAVLQIIKGDKTQPSLFAPASQVPAQEEKKVEVEEKKQEGVLSVGAYLDLLNDGLREFEGRIIGEISSLDIRDRYLFFGIKDKKDESLISCFMWRNNYAIQGVQLREGMEIIVHGFPEIYKPGGRLSLRVDTIELVGEGALKKAYDELRAKLEKEGLFDAARKRPIPEYPQKIGIITSRTGAVIHDFLNNIGKFGYHIYLMDSRVEGQRAVKELLQSIRYFRDKDIDVLVMIRGGGSLESLLAFNNEMLVREISRFPRPVICGIGHDKDVPLAALVADRATSTPTAVTKVLNDSWERALAQTHIYERDIMNHLQHVISDKKFLIRDLSDRLESNVEHIFEEFAEMQARLRERFAQIEFWIKDARKRLFEMIQFIISRYGDFLIKTDDVIGIMERSIKVQSPERALKLGYSIVTSKGRVVRSIKDIHKGDELDIGVGDGIIEAVAQNTGKRRNQE